MASTVTTEQFSLRWNNFHSNLKSGFHELLQQADMVDVTLAVDGHFLQAHKVVLSICSPYFKQMFKVNPCKHPIVILKDVGHENMKDILQFMYMGEVSVLRENLSSFLRTAEILQVKGLTGDDSTEDSNSHKDEKPDLDMEEDNDIYNQLIEATNEDIPISYPQIPPQTSPLPLNTSKRQSKIPTPPMKRTKCSESYSTSYNSSKPLVNKESEVPKVKSEYKSCDFPNAQNTKTSGENDEAKDYSKGGGGSWDGNANNSTGTGTNTLITSNDTNVTDQGNKVENRPALRAAYQCDQCLKRFSRRDHLRTHEKNIHGSDAGPFKCVICEQLYKNTESLRKHISKFHFTNLNDLGHKVEVRA
ncbi:uncharacterized protein LOC143199153 isoform X1 [Rhynchophorus ferrugineus]|uniref:uncharacterized protein LOC143199153 isoform X1 n=1 Tax=Rhynchophorus ferrugineus TaxID=354439 RepID=UPI003FCD1FAB